MNENSGSKNNPTMNTHDNDAKSETESRILTQDVRELRKSYIAHLTKQLEDMTRLIKGLSSRKQPNFYPRESTSASLSATGYQRDICYYQTIFFI